MLYARSPENKAIRALPGLEGACPFCGEGLIPKCGELRIYHWSHRTGGDCDAWSEPETEWHLAWKALFPESCVEQTIIRNGEKHRADVRLPDGTVVEFQSSPLSPAEIRTREEFYGRGEMIWVFNVEDCFDRFDIYDAVRHQDFRWKHPREHIAYASAKNFLDFGGLLFNVRYMKSRDESIGYTYRCRGWGHSVPRDRFEDLLCTSLPGMDAFPEEYVCIAYSLNGRSVREIGAVIVENGAPIREFHRKITGRDDILAFAGFAGERPLYFHGTSHTYLERECRTAGWHGNNAVIKGDDLARHVLDLYNTGLDYVYSVLFPGRRPPSKGDPQSLEKARVASETAIEMMKRGPIPPDWTTKRRCLRSTSRYMPNKKTLDRIRDEFRR
jgi:hypothetical protein